MNVYNEAHNLARAISESEEFKQYSDIKKTVSSNPEIATMINDFQSKQFELQAKQMMGEETAPEFAAQIQNLYGIMSRDPLTAQYLQCEIRFSMMMNDIYKILGEVAGLGIPGQENNE